MMLNKDKEPIFGQIMMFMKEISKIIKKMDKE